MQRTEVVHHEYHAATQHSFHSVQLNPNYVDASTQPRAFKHYPHFFRRFPLDLNDSIHAFIHLTSAITFQKQYREGLHALRVYPSAGALYPTELYVQLRGIRGMIDGIYHLEIETNTLTLIYELIDDGLEGYLPDHRLVKGIIFLVSCVYFRSSWKYQNRSLRYCLLDSGHHLGAIAAAALVYQRPLELCFEFDALALNDDLSLDPQEFATGMAIAGNPRDRTVRRLRSPLPWVCGTDYFEPNRFVEASYRNTRPTVSTCPLAPPAAAPVDPMVGYEPERLRQAILQRRSARRLRPQEITAEQFHLLWHSLTHPLPTASNAALICYAVVHRVAGLKPGLYQKNTRLQTGDFAERTGYLCLNQAIARDGAVVFFFVLEAACATNYAIALQAAGFLGHRAYLVAESLGLGCSGIGAFYDEETQAFLGTDGAVLYAVAIGHS